MNPQAFKAGMRALMQPVDREVITVDASVSRLDVTKLSRATVAVIVRFASGPVRVLMHGVDPTSATGDLRYDGDVEVLNYYEATQLRMTRAGTTNGTVVATYYNEGLLP